MPEDRATPPISPPMTPVAPAERVVVLDVLRGFALLGILLANMAAFNSPLQELLSGTHSWTEPIDRAARVFVMLFVQGKFYSLFSFLFGMGMAIQLQRAEASGRPFAGFFARRMFWLLVIGMAHGFLLWYGDILALYAAMGLLLILFRKRANKTLLIWAVVLYLLPLTLMALGAAVDRTVDDGPTEAVEAAVDSGIGLEEEIEHATAIYSGGTYGEIFALRATEVAFIYGIYIFFGSSVLALFLVGLNVGRRGVFRDLPAHLDRFRRLLPAMLVAGLATSAVGVAATELGDPESLWMLLGQATLGLGAPAMCASYVAGIVLLFHNERWRRRLIPMAAVGRMALTNYVMQSLICTTIFYSYGLGLFGLMPPSQGLLLSLGIYLVQIPLSNWWLQRYRFGPMEWIWRSLTYGRIQPMRTRT